MGPNLKNANGSGTNSADQNGSVFDSEKLAETRKRRPPIFEYPNLPNIEIGSYFLIVIGAILYSWYKIYEVSSTYDWGDTGWGWYKDSYLPLFGWLKKDHTNDEWTTMRPLMGKLFLFMIGHSLIFNLSEKIFGEVYPQLSSAISLTYSLTACCCVFSPSMVALCVAQGSVIFLITRIVKHQLAVWAATVGMLYLALSQTLENTQSYKVAEDENPFFQAFFDFTLMSYKILGYVSYNIEYLNGKTRTEDANFVRGLFRMMYYVFYMPYLISLIVLYPDFERQRSERKTRIRDWREIAIFALRIGFWYCVIEFTLHFMHFDAILADIPKLNAIRKDALVCIGMATGTFFHLKYVIIFGLPSIFARLDNMQPLEGPICLQRVMLYSKVWRQFDRGLYFFFKKYIFLPICRPTFSVPRKIFGVLVSYSFVVVWHGLTHQYITWIILNIIGLFQELFGKIIYTIPAVKNFREAHVSDRNFRRILAWLQVLPYAFALYANFYFLAGSEAGWVFVERIFWQENVPMKWPAWLLISLGYFFANCCMEVERFQSERKKKEGTHKKNE